MQQSLRVFSSAETALISVNTIKMRTLSEAGHKSAGLVIKLNENKSKLLSTILIGNNIVNLGASALATIFMQNKFHSIPISVGTGILTFIVIIFGEIIPKTAASLYADKVATQALQCVINAYNIAFEQVSKDNGSLLQGIIPQCLDIINHK